MPSGLPGRSGHGEEEGGKARQDAGRFPDVRKPGGPDMKKPGYPDMGKPESPDMRQPGSPGMKKPGHPGMKKPGRPGLSWKDFRARDIRMGWKARKQLGKRTMAGTDSGKSLRNRHYRP